MTETSTVPAVPDLALRWCRMWNAEPTLAHELLTPDAVQWSGLTPGLDDLVGPEPTVPFMTRWAIDPGPRFTPRLAAADGAGWLAYCWDAVLPDGRILSGLDVNALRDGRVAENWTIAGDRRITAADPTPRSASRDVLLGVARGWARGTEAVLAPDVVLHSRLAEVGDVDGRDAVAAVLRARGAAAVHREPIVDPDRGTATVMWTAPTGGNGLDLLVVRDDRVVDVRSFPAARPFRY
ncbi:hypothetical protein [Actinomycetospora termitidis]|uniref:SnoaL-like domain-containing protein n=1 Tax=Actinomycetospora termitidis TaxID=3053470 RepID=A0ABT7MB54_9PSEU|nr:hypothetical protein [Actinomycetospora sp. Odt1-22]MDL5157863.1 hypothetical protein [Actinomycetospora sp. Odt1-22]